MFSSPSSAQLLSVIRLEIKEHYDVRTASFCPYASKMLALDLNLMSGVVNVNILSARRR